MVMEKEVVNFQHLHHSFSNSNMYGHPAYIIYATCILSYDLFVKTCVFCSISVSIKYPKQSLNFVAKVLHLYNN